MIVEMLRFQVGADEFHRWAEVDRETWTAYLEDQPGFVRKEVWRGEGDDVRVIVWWRSRQDWASVTADQVAAVDASMGEWFRTSSLVTFSVV